MSATYAAHQGLPKGATVPNDVPKNMDEDMQAVWITLFNAPSGRAYAEYIRDHNVNVKWSSSLNSGGKTKTVCTDSGCSTYIELGRPDKKNDFAWQANKAALLAHETFHYMNLYGATPDDSLFEEYMAYKIQDKVMQEFESKGWTTNWDGSVTQKSGLKFQGEDPYDSVQLRRWFVVNNLHGIYKNLDPYPPSVLIRQ